MTTTTKPALVVNDALVDYCKDQGLVPQTLTIPADDPWWRETLAGLLVKGELSSDTYLELTAHEPTLQKAAREKGGQTMSTTTTTIEDKAGAMFGDGDNVNVKTPSERYSEKRFVGRHVKTGAEITNPFTGTATEKPSQRDYAKSGVLFKHLANKAGLGVQLDDHERSLLDDMATRDQWAGMVNGEFKQGFVGVKALLDDATSGGVEITPTWFDDSLITFPLLSGELLPYIDLKPVPRGRRVEGGSVSTPTVSWGQGDNVTVDLFDTADLVAEINSTVYGVAVAVEIGRDFLSDAAVNVGQQLTTLVGERLANELDKVIAGGNGSSQVQGILQASGLSTVTADNGAGGPPTLNDYISLMFAVAKQYRTPASRPAFVSNDTSYQRSRSIAIDTATPTTDQRPALAPLTEISSYATLGWRHAIENNLANTVCAFGALAKYRLYRRMGLEIRFEQGGKELTRRNLVLLVARARFAGRIMDSSAWAKWTSGQG